RARWRLRIFSPRIAIRQTRGGAQRRLRVHRGRVHRRKRWRIRRPPSQAGKTEAVKTRWQCFCETNPIFNEANEVARYLKVCGLRSSTRTAVDWVRAPATTNRPTLTESCDPSPDVDGNRCVSLSVTVTDLISERMMAISSGLARFNSSDSFARAR